MGRILQFIRGRTGEWKPTHKSIAWRLMLLCLLSYGSFASAENSNVITREALMISIVRTGDVKLGPLANLSMDRAFVNGSYYSDKAPGLSLLALPSGFVVVEALASGGDAAWFNKQGGLSLSFHVLALITTIFSVGLIASISIIMLYYYNLNRSISNIGALFCAGALAFATPFWGWSTVFFGHAVTGALLLIGYILLERAMLVCSSLHLRPRWWHGLAAGFVLGFAFVVEFPAGPAVAIIGICCFVASMLQANRKIVFLSVFLPAACGVILAVFPLGVYNAAAFGSATAIGYGSEQYFPGMNTGIFGISIPSVQVAGELLYGWSRGLIVISPILVLVPASWMIGLPRSADRLSVIVALLVFIYYLALNSGYYYWDGGYSTGPRHLIPSLPLALIMVGRLWDSSAGWLRTVFMGFFLVSMAITLMYTSVEMYMPPHNLVANPLLEYILPRFTNGELNRVILGKIQLLHGFPSLLPLLVGWAILGFSIARCGRALVPVRQPARKVSEPIS